MSTNYDDGGPAGPPNWEGSTQTGANSASSLAAGWGDPTCPTPMWMDRSRLSTGETSRFSMECGRATCPVCGPNLRTRQVESYTALLEGRPDLYFGTFTTDPQVTGPLGGPLSVRAYLVHAFSGRFRFRMKRRCEALGGSFAYLAVTEQHNSGAPHLHILMQAGVPEGVLRGQAYASGFGPSMSVRPVEPDAASVRFAVRYVLKSAFGPTRHARHPRHGEPGPGLLRGRSARCSHSILNDAGCLPFGKSGCPPRH